MINKLNLNIKFIKNLICKFTGFWCNKISNVSNYRIFEINNLIQNEKINNELTYRILDFGCGNGVQTAFLAKKFFKSSVHGIDILRNKKIKINNYNYRIYNGINLPYKNNYFDIIFSSNVLEHISNTDTIQSELKRILRKKGIIYHFLPSVSWRFWTIMTGIVKYWYPDLRPHGEISSSSLGEVFHFRKVFWIKIFIRNGFKIISIFKNKIFYTGHEIFGPKISMKNRVFISKFLGSSCNIFIIKKNYE